MVASGSEGSGAIRVVLNSGSLLCFFEPTAERVSRDAECARESTQTAALNIGAQNLVSLLWRVAVGLWFFTTAPYALRAELSLFAILREAVAGKFIAAAMNTFDSDHERALTISPAFVPLPNKDEKTGGSKSVPLIMRSHPFLHRILCDDARWPEIGKTSRRNRAGKIIFHNHIEAVA